jgi:hypothetical protein
MRKLTALLLLLTPAVTRAMGGEGIAAGVLSLVAWINGISLVVCVVAGLAISGYSQHLQSPARTVALGLLALLGVVSATKIGGFALLLVLVTFLPIYAFVLVCTCVYMPFARPPSTEESTLQSKPRPPSADLSGVPREHLGTCPNCGEELRVTAIECWKCEASFGIGAAWRVQPYPQ